MIVEAFKKIVPEAVLKIHTRLTAAGHKAYLVGGAVRDICLGIKKIAEWDMASSASPSEVMQLFEKFYQLGPKFGTVTVIVDGLHVEVTTFRKESKYEDSRHPSCVKFISDIEEDLGRRDFTINAMALDLSNGNVIDLYHGIEDIKNKVIRTVNDPYVRFNEDALRMMRAVRFAVTLGFELDNETESAIKNMAQSIAKISNERIRDEIRKIMISDDPARGFCLLYTLGLLSEIFPDVLNLDNVVQVINKLNFIEKSFELRIALVIILLDAKIDEFLQLLRLSKETKMKIKRIVQGAKTFFEYKDHSKKDIVKRKTCFIAVASGKEDFINTMSLVRALDSKIDIIPYVLMFNDIIKKDFPFDILDLKIKGSDIIKACPLISGRNINDLMKKLYKNVVCNGVKNDKETLIDLAKHIFKNTD